MANDDLTRLLEKHSTLELLDRNIKEANQFFASVERDHKVQIAVGFTATCAVSQLASIPIPEIKKRGTAPLQELDHAGIGHAMKVTAETSRGRTLAKQQLGAAVWGLLNNTLLSKSVALEFEAHGVPDGQGLVYAQNLSKVLFGKIDEYIQKYAAASPNELKAAGILDAVRMVDPSLVEEATPAPSVATANQKSGPSKILIVGAALAVTSVVGAAVLVLTGSYPLTSTSVTGQVGEFLGMVFAPFAIASVVAGFASVVGRIIRGRPVSDATHFWWGFLTVVVVTALVAMGTHAQREVDMVQYQPPGCEFKVTFPRAPEIQLIPFGQLKFEQATAATRSGILRVECFPWAALLGEPSRDALRSLLERHASQQGLAIERIRVDELRTGVFGYLVGDKILSGDKVRYEVRMQLGQKSLLVLTAGGLASAFPPAEAEAFFSSVK